jgi:hypothetical protein
MSADHLAGTGTHGERFQPTRPGGAGLFWPSDRHLFRRRRAGSTWAGMAMALVVLVCAAGYVVLTTA